MPRNAKSHNGPVLSLREIAIAAGGKRLIDGLTLDLHSAELLSVCGPSGCGKSTLLRAIAGLVSPTEGLVLLQGSEPRAIGWPVFRRRVVLVSQRPVLFDDTVRENLARPFTYRYAPSQFPDTAALALLERLGIEPERWKQNALSLSTGQQQRVCVVRALLLRPDVLLLDEPSSALDEQSAAALEDTISRWVREEGGSAILVSHDRYQVARWCDREVDLRDFRAEQN